MSEKKKSKKHPPSSNDFEPANDVTQGKKVPAGISPPEIWREVTDELKHIL